MTRATSGTAQVAPAMAAILDQVGLGRHRERSAQHGASQHG
jgi:hypothetical protein